MRKKKTLPLLSYGFSLMEMMVVLLIVAIIAAASAPMVTKKMARNAGSGDSPWVFTGLNNSIAYNLNGGDSIAIIGNTSYKKGSNGPQYPRLVLASGNDSEHPAFAFADKDGNFSGQINMNATTKVVTMNDSAVGNSTTAFGFGQEIDTTIQDVVAIGNDLHVKKTGSAIGDKVIAIGNEVSVSPQRAIAIGFDIATDMGKESTNLAKTANGIMIGDRLYASNGIAIGQYFTKAPEAQSLAVGYKAVAGDTYTIAMGAKVTADNSNASDKTATLVAATSIGHETNATNYSSLAIGYRATASGKGSIAIGHPYGGSTITQTKTEASGRASIALGDGAQAIHDRSTAIGCKAKTTNINQIVLGTASDTVYIPGRLVVDGETVLGRNNNVATKLCIIQNGGGYELSNIVRHDNGGSYPMYAYKHFNPSTIDLSDRRLKNVDKAYTASLEELKQLEFFHYTFKDDKTKTPRVGVMAQDLQKVFPDAVTKGDDGFLRIRWEDMFYAVINAVKDLDKKITAIIADITGMQDTIKAQQAQIEELEKQNAEFEKRLKKLEKRRFKNDEEQ